jgi:carboxymethylenebutenolidase
MEVSMEISQINPGDVLTDARTTTITTPAGEQGVHRRRPSGAPARGVIVLFHRGPGMDDGTKAAMDVFVRAGYLVVAPDRYYRDGPWLWADPHELREAGPGSAAATRFERRLLGTSEDMVAEDLSALLGSLEQDASVRSLPRAVVGYCIGARSAIRALVDHPEVFAAGALLHPSFCVSEGPGSPHESVPAIQSRLYVAIGQEDRLASPAANQPLIEAVGQLGSRGRVDILPGADHGFAVPGAGYHAEAARASYERALATFAAAMP